jgi:hypothetical protein
MGVGVDLDQHADLRFTRAAVGFGRLVFSGAADTGRLQDTPDGRWAKIPSCSPKSSLRNV